MKKLSLTYCRICGCDPCECCDGSAGGGQTGSAGSPSSGSPAGNKGVMVPGNPVAGQNPAIAIQIANNTPGEVPLQLFVPGNPNDVANQVRRYQWDISSTGSYSGGLPVSIQAKWSAGASFQTFTPTGKAFNPNDVIDLLNSLNIGSFWLETIGGVTYVVTNNDTVIYGDLVIGTAFNATFIFSWDTTGSLIRLFQIAGSGGMIDWGDGTIEPFSAGAVSHGYASVAIYNVKVQCTSPGAVTSLNFGVSAQQVISISNLSNLTGLLTLNLFQNELTSIDVSGNPTLTNLNVGSNSLSSLDVTNNVALTSLQANVNPFSSIDVSNNVNLTTLALGDNNLSAIDISNNTLLVFFSCGINQLTAIDISNNPLLLNVGLNNNQLPTSQVNGVLIDLDGFGLSNGLVDLQNQTPAAPPSGAGAAAKTSLQGKGWTVTTD